SSTRSYCFFKTLRKDRYTVIINASEKAVKLCVCILCGLQLCVSNISTIQERHSGACAAQRALDVRQDGAPPLPNPYAPMVPADVVTDVKKELALFFYTSGTAFARADNPHMKRALKLLGVDSPSAKQLRTTYLNDTHAVLQRRVAIMMETLLVGLGLMMCTDGWRNKRAANGRPLVQQISKTLHECDKIGNALDTAQVHKYGAKRPVATHIDTRFAILFTICKDILRSKDALRMMVEQGDWNKVAASSTNAACFDVLKDGMSTLAPHLAQPPPSAPPRPPSPP
ncbi:hypothetical protein V8C86DRAFT_2535438, partial [Haematococcus lacustris]